MITFSVVRSQRAFEDVVGQIERAVLDGQLKPGERLPPEREVTDQLKVSRGTVREAYRILEYAGLITVRKGRLGGVFISHASTLVVSHSLKWLLRMRRITLRELTEFRERLEGAAARDAARRAKRQHIARLEGIVDELRRIAPRRELWPRVLELDLEFHQTMAQASGNALVDAVMCSLIDCMREVFDVIPDDNGKTIFRHHRRLLRLIRLGEADKAEAMVRRQIRHFSRLMLARLGRSR